MLAVLRRQAALSALRVAPVSRELSTLTMRMHKPSTLAIARRSTLWIKPRGKAVSSSTPSTGATKTAAERRQEMVEKGKSSWGKLKDLWQKYGIVAVGTYFSMYGVVLGSIYVAIEQGWVSTARQSVRGEEGKKDGESEEFNLVTATNKVISLAEDLGIAKHLDVQRVNSKTGSFVIAWVATKFTEPLRLAVTLAITPRIARLVGRAPKKAIKAATKA